MQPGNPHQQDKDTTDRTVEELLTAAAELCVEADHKMKDEGSEHPEAYRYYHVLPDGSTLLHPLRLAQHATRHAERWGEHVAAQTEMHIRDGSHPTLRPIPVLRPLTVKVRRLLPEDELDEALAGAYGPQAGGAA